MAAYDALLKPLTIKHLTIRNRIMGSSHAPAYGKDGKPQERYQAYHEEKAKGGIGLAMFGGSSSVSIDSPASMWSQISVADDSIIPYFKQFSARHPRAWRQADVPAHPYGPAHPLGHGELVSRRWHLRRFGSPRTAPSPRRWRISISSGCRATMPPPPVAAARAISTAANSSSPATCSTSSSVRSPTSAPINMAAASRTACASISRRWPRRASRQATTSLSASASPATICWRAATRWRIVWRS